MSLSSTDTTKYVVDRLTNYNNTAEGAVLPPRQRGQTRVPYVSGLQILQTTQNLGNTVFVITWQDARVNASIQVDHYNIYYKIAGTNQQPVGPFTAQQAPATINVPSTTPAAVTFIIQTVLANGMTSELTSSPAIAGFMQTPIISGVYLVPGSVTGASLAAATIDMTKFAAGIQPPVIVTSLPALPQSTYPQGALVVLTTDNKIYRSTGSAWIRNVDGGDLVANSVTTGALAAGSVTTNIVAAGAIDATRITLFDELVVGMTLTNNSPTSGNVAWSSCTVYYNGVGYPVSSGNTSSGNTFIYWTVGGTTFTQAAAFSPTANVFLIATNSAGVGDTAWNKQAANSITNGNIFAGAVGSNQLGSGAVSSGKIASSAIDSLGLFAAGLQPPNIVSSLPVSFVSYPAGALVVLTSDNKVYRSTGSAWTKAVDGADLVANSVTTGSLASGAVTTGILAAGAVDATKITIVDELVIGLTLTNNSPLAGNVAWSSCTVYYNGTGYSISSGNTTGGNQFIYWTVGNTTFTQAAAFTPGAANFLIATNTSGVGDTAWNKQGTGSVVGANINLPSVLYGPNGSLMVDGVTWTNNSPTGTSVAWSAGTVTYKGISYTLSSGSSGTNTWIYWQLSSPTTFQSAATYPTLGVNDFLLGINNSFGAGGTQGNFSQAIELHDANNERIYLIPDALFAYNAEGNVVLSLARTAADSVGAPSAGSLRLFDGTGSGSLGQGQKIIATGSDGLIQMASFEVNVSNSPGSVHPNFKNLATTYTGTNDVTFAALSGGTNAMGTPRKWLNILLDGSSYEIPCY